MPKLQGIVLGLMPFIFIGYYWHMRYASLSRGSAARRQTQSTSQQMRSPIRHQEAFAKPEGPVHAEPSVVEDVESAVHTATQTSVHRDVSRDWPAPTLSSKRLVDGSPNWLPVPNAESDNPDDLAWRKQLPTDSATPCPVGRRPYHTILTAQASLYQEWQTKIFYYYFRKAQAEDGRCTEMTGFTRLLAGHKDGLMDYMPTVVVPAAAHNVTRGFPVINRPWTMVHFLQMREWRERVTEEYVYIAETDHMLRHAIPNRATPQLAVAFFFPYMSPRDPKCGAVAKKWFSGDILTELPPVGPSPALMHVDVLRKLATSWYELSVALKANREADSAYGWMLEMWGALGRHSPSTPDASALPAHTSHQLCLPASFSRLGTNYLTPLIPSPRVLAGGGTARHQALCMAAAPN